MQKGSVARGAATLIFFVLSGHAQVLSPPEILDPAMRALQQKHFPELKAAAVDITTHNYPYRFFLSRKLDLSEKQEKLADQRAIRFAKFQDHTVLQVTGNYFAAYSEESMDRAERVTQTYLDVMLPILRAVAPRLNGETQINAFAIEIAHHVRKRVLGVTVESPENVALIVPSAAAQSAPLSNDRNVELSVLKQSAVYIDSQPVILWPDVAHASAPPAVSAAVKPPAASPITVDRPVSEPATAPAPARDLSPDALQKQQSALQALLDRITKELDGQAHFISYAPPALISFRKLIYLQLSIMTTLDPSASGSQYRIAALSFDHHVSHLIRPLLAYFKEDTGIDGVVFSSTVKVPGQSAESSITQSVEFFLSLAELRRFEQYDITGQQLISSGFVLINGERIGLELQSAESDSR